MIQKSEIQNPKSEIVLALLLVADLAAHALAGSDREVIYDGSFTLKPNGDMAVVTKLIMPMVQYQRLRQSIPNLYLMMRGLASSRADTEVVDKKSEWDDANRTITFSMTVLGAAKNMGTHWEIPVVKGALFTNFNEKERTFYFNEAASGPLGDIRGTTRGILPEGATQAKWDPSRRVVTYVMPAPKSVGTANTALLIPGAVVSALGLLFLLASFFVARKPQPAVAWQTPPSPPLPPPPPGQAPPPFPGR